MRPKLFIFLAFGGLLAFLFFKLKNGSSYMDEYNTVAKRKEITEEEVNKFIAGLAEMDDIILEAKKDLEK